MLTMSALNREYPEATIQQKAKELSKNLPRLKSLADYIRAEEEAVKEYNVSARIFCTDVNNWDINDTSEGSYFLTNFLSDSDELIKAQANLLKARQELRTQLKFLIN